MGVAPLSAPAQDGGAAAAARVNDFGFDLLRAVGSKSNACVSPTSIALALAMARAGAGGQTAVEMDAVLHDLGRAGQASEIAALIKSLRSVAVPHEQLPGEAPDPTLHDQDPVLSIANQAFMQTGMPFEPAYLDQLSSGFGAGVGLLDYRSDPEAARKLINNWIAGQTKGRIPQILQPGDVDELTRFALANAIYLKAAWQDPFDPASTKPLAFTTSSGSKVTVPTMASGALRPYAVGAGYRAVDLQYAWSNLSMTVVVPDNMASFTQTLTAAKLKAIVASERTYQLDFTLPRFAIDLRVDLSEVLRAMGMPTAFSASADFSGITKADKLAIHKVIHQANIDVNESGTTAAAATVVTGRSMMGPGTPHAVFHVDKPFLYFIRDTASGAVLFMGEVANPS